jgi:mono/diheme cytochrome c family protein
MIARDLRSAAVAIGACLAAACAAAGGETPAPAATAAPATEVRSPGQLLYGKHCLGCHQADGRGVRNMQPPIVGGTWVQGDARALALFVLSGGFDSASRKDSDVGNVMPPFRQLSDADLAELLTFVRQRFGNGASAVSAAEVAEARANLGSDPNSAQKGPEPKS